MTARASISSELTAAALPGAWRAKASELERFAPAAAVAFRDAALALETALRADANAVLTLAEASMASGYSKDHLRHQIASGAIPNVGKKRRPRVRAGDLPRKLVSRTAYDPNADAMQLVRRTTP